MQKRRFASRIKERAIEKFFLLNGLFAILVLAGIFILLMIQAWPAVKELGVNPFAGTAWDPTSPEKETYGMLALLTGTLMVAIGAMVIAVPVGIATAAWLADVADSRVREIVKPVIEILAAIPSVVVGFLGLVVLNPLLARLFHTSSGLNGVNGSILLAIMALPTIISISEDAIISVPQELKSASLALGANQWQTLVRVTMPSALSGIIASIMLGMGRAIGETMTVLMVCGNAAAMPHSYLDPVRTMTATIAIELGETVQGSTHYHALFIIAFILFIITFVFNLISDIVLQRYQKVSR
ncbi:MAG TPA: phosphate ABC transporter permease subunit PstC [bacterium]|nr:phosphate ABC transporter permease subunit PstC [bacterium]HQG46159.1 phosphate ABC transporter permease subunit PstC [bacterium]HQI47756.1 phosphate ABC transporter permease subunit PstC [bacterium]HQJ63186.1 phosphate ABC transporter permease subunit PstC [bacterium]